MAEKVFYAIVTQWDCDQHFHDTHPDMTRQGPMIWEQFLHERHTTPDGLRTRVDSLRGSHGWARIAKVIVDIPEGES